MHHEPPGVRCTRIFDIQQNVFRQASEEFRLQSHYKGKLNFSVGGNFVDYTTQSNYYVFGNGLNVPAEAIALGTLIGAAVWNASHDVASYTRRRIRDVLADRD